MADEAPPDGAAAAGATAAAMKSRMMKAASSSPAQPRDFLSLSVARHASPLSPFLSYGGYTHGVIVSTRAGGRHGKVQLWTVAFPRPGARPEMVEMNWAELRSSLACSAEALREGGAEAAEAAAEAHRALAARPTLPSVARPPQPSFSSDPAAALERPKRERVRSVRAPSPDSYPQPWGVASAAPAAAHRPPFSDPPGPPRSHHKRARSPQPAENGRGWALVPGAAATAPTPWFGRQPSSGYRGVYHARHGNGGFRAEGRFEGRKFCVGNYYATAVAAAEAYDDAARRNGVPERLLNFPRDGSKPVLVAAREAAEAKAAGMGITLQRPPGAAAAAPMGLARMAAEDNEGEW